MAARAFCSGGAVTLQQGGTSVPRVNLGLPSQMGAWDLGNLLAT